MRKFRIPYIPYRSLLLSTTVLNDNQSGGPIQFFILQTHKVNFLQKKLSERHKGMTLFVTYTGNKPSKNQLCVS